ncbi:MAG: hypothetical protein FWD03_04120 [Defluviitaleaceae bacterium]|nr:hypothetical protein [Defluviitaleaceae bacterium]
MAVISTPVNGRVRLTYFGNDAPDLRINGIDPTSSAIQIATLASGLQSIQTASINDGYLIVETALTDA